MRVQAGLSLVMVLVSGLSVGNASVHAQAQAQPARPAGPGAATGRVAAIPGANEVVATVAQGNVTDKVTKGEVVSFLSRYPIPANENREQVYRDAVESLINTTL